LQTINYHPFFRIANIKVEYRQRCINTGGLSLKPQEIRQALNQRGGGVGFLKNMVEQDSFKEVVGISNKRMAGSTCVNAIKN
jgi:chorismate synthase